MNIWKHSVMKNFDERTGGTTIPRKLRITYVQFFVLGIYFEKLSGYTASVPALTGEYAFYDLSK